MLFGSVPCLFDKIDGFAVAPRIFKDNVRLRAMKEEQADKLCEQQRLERELLAQEEKETSPPSLEVRHRTVIED